MFKIPTLSSTLENDHRQVKQGHPDLTPCLHAWLVLFVALYLVNFSRNANLVFGSVLSVEEIIQPNYAPFFQPQLFEHTWECHEDFVNARKINV